MFKSKYILIILFQLFSAFSANAQIRNILKNLLTEERAAAKILAREEGIAVKELSVSKNLSKGHKANFQEFWEKYHGDDIVELAESLNDEVKKDKKPIFYLREILLNKSYPKLYLAICQKLKKDTLGKPEIEGLLLGYKIKGMGIDSNKLYNLYFNLSQTFAKDELEKLKLYYNCDETVNAEINLIAENRGIQLNGEICKKNEDSSFVNEIINMLTPIVIGYFLWILLKKLRFLFKKAWTNRINKNNNP